MGTVRTFDFWGWFDRTSAEAVNSEVGRILIASHFTVWHTGGGCLAWGKNSTDNKHHCMITRHGVELGIDADIEQDDWDVGLYDADGDFVEDRVTGLREAIEWCDLALADPEECFKRMGGNE